ncbi:MAG: hypothetical protein NTX25_05045 [Proteobacteria bacterium]|nr:hypothetical protein [Pseudomonadota bacterium]
MEGTHNEKGYDILGKRVVSSQTSWASIYECQQMHDLLVSLGVTNENMKIFRQLSGNVCETYQIANIDQISQKKQRQLPSKARVYDLINFATEVSTHTLEADKSRKVNAYIGSLISTDYDLEGTADIADDFQDLFLKTA